MGPRTVAFAAALLALAGCEARVSPVPAAAPAPSSAEPAPPLPAWSQAYLGRGLRAVLPEDGECVGNTDSVTMRYRGSPPGAAVVGWGWDRQAKAPVERVLFVDTDFRIVGAGETGLPRPDVVASLAEVTSGTTGWRGVTSRTTGPIAAFGVTTDGRGACMLGFLDLSGAAR